MLEGLQQLIELQGLDAELAQLEAQQGAIPERRASLSQERADCEARVAEAGEALREAEGGQRRAEADLADQQALVQRLEGQQFQVKSNDAYTALLSEIEHAKQAISDCETKILESMEAIEGASARLAEAESESAETGGRVDAEEKALDAHEKDVLEKLESARSRREGMAAGVESGLLAQYTRIIRRRSPAIAIVAGEMCTGCRVNIPPQSYIEILKGERIITCGNCHRILIQDPNPDPEPEASASA
jgi:predicted  nucleic acid-binding Zn-ribbon protein